MRRWFSSLQTREQGFVLTAVVVVVLTILWAGIWKPLDSSHQLARERVATWQQSLAELRPMRGQLATANGNAPAATTSNQSLVVIVDNSLRQRGLYNSLQRSLPTPAGNGIRVEFENAVFDDLVLWLGDLHRQYGLRVETGSFSVASNGAAGRVNSSVTLER